MSERTQVVCGHCDAVVGLPSDRLKDGPRCPSCHSSLFEGKPVELTEKNFDKHLNRGDEIVPMLHVAKFMLHDRVHLYPW